MTNHAEGTQVGTQEWWMAVRSIADLVHCRGVTPDEDHIIRAELAQQGFSSDGIAQALDWIDKAALSGNAVDALSMLQPVRSGVRVEHPLERACMHPLLRQAFEVCRTRGLLGDDLVERLMEGVRTMDTRDWDDPEIESFFDDVLAASAPQLAGVGLADVLNGDVREQFN